MNKSQRSRTTLSIALLFTPALATAQTAAPPLESLPVQASFGGEPVAPGATLTLTFAQPFPYARGRYAVMVGSEDVTAQFQRTGPHTLRGVFTDAALPGGESVLKVLGISADSQWVLLAQLPLTVQARADGAQRALTKPGAVVGLKTQAWERHSSTAQPPSRTSFVDGTLQGSLQTDHGNEAWAIKSNTQIAGSTYRPEALQYGTRGAQAAQVDLGSYLVEGNQGAHTPYATRLALGHVQAGEHPLLANSIANRGLVLRQRLGERVELMLSSGSTDGVRSQISTPRPSW